MSKHEHLGGKEKINFAKKNKVEKKPPAQKTQERYL